TDPRRGGLLAVGSLDVAGRQGVGGVQVRPQVLPVEAVAGGHRAGGAGPAVGLDAVAPGVVLVVQEQEEGAAVGGALLGPEHLAARFVAEIPRLAAGPLALLSPPALVVVAVSPRPVAGPPVARPRLVARVGPVARRVVAEGGSPDGGELAGS